MGSITRDNSRPIGYPYSPDPESYDVGDEVVSVTTRTPHRGRKGVVIGVMAGAVMPFYVRFSEDERYALPLSADELMPASLFR